MLTKTAAGNYVPLLALGLAAAVGGCSTQEDAQPAQFNSPPQIEAIYAHDGIYGPSLGLYDVQIYANKSDPHYPTLTGETGAQNAADVSLFPPDYNSIIVEVNTPLNGTMLGTAQDLNNESYCMSGSNPAAAPFEVLDVGSGSNTPLLGSICYDPTSQLFRYPELTFVLGSDSAFDTTAQPFTCQTFTPDVGDPDTGASFKPNNQYAIAINTALDVNENGIRIATPTDSTWTNGQFKFTTAGFDVMAAGYQDPNTAFFTYISKPYLGFLKDCPVNAQFCNPVDGTFSDPNNALGADGLNGNIPLRIFLTLAALPDSYYSNPFDPTSLVVTDNLKNNVTLTRADGSIVPANVILSGSRGRRMLYVAPPVSWEPGQTYTVTINQALAAGDETATAPSNLITLTTAPPPYTFTIPAAPASVTVITPSGGDYVIYAGAAGLSEGVSPDSFNSFGIQSNVPIDPTTVNTTNITVTDPTGATVPGTVELSTTVQFADGVPTQEGAPSGNHEIIFTPAATAVFKSNTTYTISASNLKVDPSVTIPGIAPGSVIPTQTQTFTTSQLNAQVFIDNVPNVQLDGLGPYCGTQGCADSLDWQFTREAAPATVTSSSVTLTEINQDGTVGATVPANNISVSEIPLSASGATSDLLWQAAVTYCTDSGPTACSSSSTPNASPYLVKCDQNYQVAYTTAIQDEDETPPASLSLQGCSGANCNDVHTFTTAAFAPIAPPCTADYQCGPGALCMTVIPPAYAAAGYTTSDCSNDPYGFACACPAPQIVYTAADTTTNPPTPDTFQVYFSGSLDSQVVNGLLNNSSNPFMRLVDSTGTQVALSCQPLADDTSFSVTCTSGVLASNAVYTASVVVSSTGACGPGTSTPCTLPIASVATLDTGNQDQQGNEIYDTLPADQVSCSWSGTLINAFATPCPQVTTTRSHTRKAANVNRSRLMAVKKSKLN